MMNFYCLYETLNDDIQARLDLLRAACEIRQIRFIGMNSLQVDHTQLPKLGRSDMLYNIGRGSHMLENRLLNDDVATFYPRNRKVDFNNDSVKWIGIHERAGLPSPRTIHDLPRDRALLDKYVQAIGGYPVVIKAAGGSRGIGVMRIDSACSLYSVVDALVSQGGRYVMREYIPADVVGRLIVLANKVISSVEYISPANDFRSSIAERPECRAASFTAEVEATAVRAIEVVDVEFGGVDIIVGNSGEHYLLEANAPVSFQTPQRLTGVDIAGLMVEHLMAKTSR